MDEQYIYLGRQAVTHFFLHIIANPNFEETTSDQIYNVMIHECRINDPEKNILIYEFNLTDRSVYVTVIQHARKQDIPTRFDKDNVLDMLMRLLVIDRRAMYVIRYNVQKSWYETFEIEEDLIGGSHRLMPQDMPAIGRVRYVITTKPIGDK